MQMQSICESHRFGHVLACAPVRRPRPYLQLRERLTCQCGGVSLAAAMGKAMTTRAPQAASALVTMVKVVRLYVEERPRTTRRCMRKQAESAHHRRKERLSAEEVSVSMMERSGGQIFGTS